MKNAKEQGCTLAVLEQTLGKSCDQINIELLVFIKKHCYAGAYLKDGYQTKDKHKKRQAYLKALALKPDYLAAQLALGWSYYYDKQHQQARDSIKQILDSPESVEYREALKLMGHTHYSAKDYSQALSYYDDSLEYSDYDEYRYELYYWTGSCHLLLKDYANAAENYTMFLQNNWEPGRFSRLVNHAEQYLQQYEQIQEKKLERADENDL
jgi:tetratricopeptide (TPR) repeat protein